MLHALGTDPGPPEAPWRSTAEDWYVQRIRGRRDWTCLVIGGNPGQRLHAAGMAWITHHLPSPHWPDGRRGYIDGMITDHPARRQGHARAILDELLAWLRGQGIDFIELNASEAGAPLYTAAGFAQARYPAMELVNDDPR